MERQTRTGYSSEHLSALTSSNQEIIGSLCVHMFVVAVTALLLCHDVCPQRAQKTELLHNMRHAELNKGGHYCVNIKV